MSLTRLALCSSVTCVYYRTINVYYFTDVELKLGWQLNLLLNYEYCLILRYIDTSHFPKQVEAYFIVDPSQIDLQ